MFFSQDWRERIKAENPDAGFGMSFLLTHVVRTDSVFDSGEVGKLLGAKWKEMDEEEKKVGSCDSLYMRPLVLITHTAIC